MQWMIRHWKHFLWSIQAHPVADNASSKTHATPFLAKTTSQEWRFAIWWRAFLAPVPPVLRKQMTRPTDFISLAIMQAVTCTLSSETHSDGARPRSTSLCGWNYYSSACNRVTLGCFLNYCHSSMCSGFALCSQTFGRSFKVFSWFRKLDKYTRLAWTAVATVLGDQSLHQLVSLLCSHATFL